MTKGSRGLRCPVLVGRRPERAVLVAARHDAATLRPVSVAVLGPAGVGKSRLVDDVFAAGGSAGGSDDVADTEAVWGHGTLADRSTPLRPLAEALMVLTRDREIPSDPSLVPFAAVLARVAPGVAWPGVDQRASAPAGPTAVGEALFRLLRALSQERPLALVIEDLHWADEDTAAALAHLARHLRQARVTVVVTAREHEPGAPDHFTEVVSACTQVLRLEPLDDDEVLTMAAACAGTDEVDSDMAARLLGRAGGLPLLVEDLMGAPDGSKPARFAEVVASRFAALGESAQRIVELAALAGDRIDLDWLTRADGSGPAIVTQALDDGVSHGLLARRDDVPVFRHALTAEVLRDEMSPHRRAEAARALAQAAERHGSASAAQRGALWAIAGDRGRSVAALLAGARDAAAGGSSAIAEDLYRRVLDPPTDLPTSVRVELVDVLLAAGRNDDAVLEAEAALDRPGRDGSLAAIRVALARAHLSRGDLAAAGRHLDLARQEIPATPGLESGVRLLEAQLALAVGGPDRAAEAAHLAGQAIGLAEAAGQHTVTCEALELTSLCRRSISIARALEPLERMLRLADEHDLGVWRVRALNEIGTLEALRDAVPDRLLRARQVAQRLGIPGTAASIEVNLAALYVMTGQTESTRVAAAAAKDLAGPLGLVPIDAAATMLDGLACGFDGDRGAMESRLRAAERLAPDDPDLAALAWAAGRGISALLHEDRSAARLALEHADGLPTPARTLNPVCGPLLLLRAVSGEDVEAQVRAAIEHASATGAVDARYPQVWLTFAGAVVDGAAGSAAGAAAAFAVADDLARPYPLFRAVARRLTAEAAQRDQWGDPTTWLREAEAEFVQRGLAAAASGCRAQLQRAGVSTTRRRSRDADVPTDLLELGVTAREAEVLALVVDRLTNAEIGGRLFLSERTVEKHVASLLRKTGTENRRALASQAARR